MYGDSQTAINKRLAELQKQLVKDAKMVVDGVFGADGALYSDVQQIKNLAQDRKNLYFLEEKIENSSK